MTENETNQRTITEQMNRKESETVGEARPGEERSEVKVKGTCTVAMMAGMATEGSGCAPRRHDDLTPHTRHTAWTHSATVWTDHVLRRFRLMYLHTIPDTCAQASPCAHHVGIMCTYEHEHTAQCSHAACTIQRAWRRAVAREWGMPSLLDSKDALGAPWLGLEHAYPNSQCRQNDRRLRYIPIIMRLHSVLFLIGWLGSLQSLLYLYRETGHVACSLRSVMSMSKPTAF